MMGAIANLIAIVLSVFSPTSAPAVYAGGPWRGTVACQVSRLPENADREETIPAPEVAAKSVAVLTDDGYVWLESKEEVRRQPIASITKLMTALVFLDHNPGWDKAYTIGRQDLVEGGKVNLFVGDTVSVKDLFNSSLVASDNGATLALARSTGLSDEEFIAAMNGKAKELGLMQTAFVDPIGLNDDNLSTVKDVARLAKAALDKSDIAAAVGKPSYRFATTEGREKILESTDWLLESDGGNGLQAVGGKTGYTDKAGYCFVGRFRDMSGRSVIVAVLNSGGGKNERFVQAKELAAWALNHCQW
ncbi:MAG: D-alanyl-D-alanine carboxypeptidase family protein [Bacillota bacterium]